MLRRDRAHVSTRPAREASSSHIPARRPRGRSASGTFHPTSFPSVCRQHHSARSARARRRPSRSPQSQYCQGPLQGFPEGAPIRAPSAWQAWVRMPQSRRRSRSGTDLLGDGSSFSSDHKSSRTRAPRRRWEPPPSRPPPGAVRLAVSVPVSRFHNPSSGPEPSHAATHTSRARQCRPIGRWSPAGGCLATSSSPRRAAAD